MIHIDASKVIYSFGPDNPSVERVKVGEEIIFSTKDCFSNQIQSDNDKISELNWQTINPATGPVDIEDAQPGDTLVVEIQDIKVEDTGVMVTIPGAGALGHILTSSEVKIIPIQDNLAIFNEHIRIPIEPMIGVIGTAPSKESIPCGVPGSHGGNMDTRLIKKGSVLYLPVFVPGAKLALGDLHAVMGDGEVSVCGVEIPGEVKVRVDLVKGRQQPWPILETQSHWYVIASAEDLDGAAQGAIEAMLEFLKPRMPLGVNDIVSLLSIAGSLEISQVVDPLKTVRMGISKEVLLGIDFKF